MTLDDDGVFIANKNVSDRLLPSAKFSIHTTGEVHRYAKGKRESTIYIEPLFQLTQVTPVGYISIPKASRLDSFDENNDGHETAAFFDIPEDNSGRMSFVIEVAPVPQQPSTSGVALNYELYSAIVRLISNFNVPSEMNDHFVHGMPKKGLFQRRVVEC